MPQARLNIKQSIPKIKSMLLIYTNLVKMSSNAIIR